MVELNDGRIVSVVNHPIDGGGWVATHEDITERRRAERQIAHMARHDALTDLPNRVLLSERLQEALSGNHHHHDDMLAVLYLDLDHFKSVNDTLGHPIGDQLLKAIAERLSSCIDGCDTVARIGGDEFAIIQSNIESPSELAMLARLICDVVKAPYNIQGHVVIVETVDRHCDRAERRHRRRRTAEERRHGALRRQGRRPRHLLLLRSRDGCAHEGAPHAWSWHCARRWRAGVRAALSAAARPQGGSGQLLRGAAALASIRNAA